VITVRKANPADALPIAELHVRTWQVGFAEYFSAEYLEGQASFLEEPALRRREEQLASPEITTLVAEQEGLILGFAAWMKNRDDLGDEVGELGAIYVDPHGWDRGVGTALITEAESEMALAGYARAILWTLGPNERTRRFYEQRGWSFDGATKPHRTGVELVRYTKVLQSSATSA
jgi:GNAT superfamily N-acetyltransferase